MTWIQHINISSSKPMIPTCARLTKCNACKYGHEIFVWSHHNGVATLTSISIHLVRFAMKSE
jgi:hypothetical protein